MLNEFTYQIFPAGTPGASQREKTIFALCPGFIRNRFFQLPDGAYGSIISINKQELLS